MIELIETEDKVVLLSRDGSMIFEIRFIFLPQYCNIRGLESLADRGHTFYHCGLVVSIRAVI